jgi:drug/metabolite transporter (DMT)-like permease
VNRGPAYIAVFLSVFGWGLSPVFIRYLSGVYDPFSMNCVRYGTAAVLLVAWSLLFRRADLWRAVRRWRPTLGLAGINIFQQAAWTIAIFHTTATSAQLLTKLQVPSVIILSFLIFRDERAIIRSRRFLLGTLLALIGVAGVLIDDPAERLLPAWNISTPLLLLVCLAWGFYAV